VISLSNVTIPATSQRGTSVGVIRVTDPTGKDIPCNLMLDPESAAFFAIAGRAGAGTLITARAPPMPVGYYAITVKAYGVNATFSDEAAFVIHVQ
jgi:hypothetical protein